MRFIHAADLHLDSPLAGLRERAGERGEELARASRRAFENMLDFAIREHVDFVIVAGDLFDGDWADYNSGLFFVRGLHRLNRAGIRVVLTRGNHDAINQMTRKLTWPQNVHEFQARSPETVLFDDLGVALHGQSFASRAIPENLAQRYPAPLAGMLNIGVLHTSLNGRAGHDPYAPCELRDLAVKGYDYWALGHVHNREVLSVDPYIVFPGNIQGRHVNEPGAKGFSLVTVDAARVRSVEHIAVDVLRWASIEVDVSGTVDLDDLRPRIGQQLDNAVAQTDGRTLAVRILLKGACQAHRMLAGDPERLEAECTSLALQSRGDVWVERIDVLTEPAHDSAQGAAMGDLAQLISRVRENAAEVQEIRLMLDRGLDKIPLALRTEISLTSLSDTDCARILRDAEAMILHRLSGAAGPA
jgi:DNA repair exonuclease SbcCD nuclease subunit